MGTVFNKKELLVLLQDFHCLTGLRSAVFDSYGIEVLAYPPELPAYCRLIRSVPDGKTGCYLCDQAACRKATRQKQTIIYPCHAGLIEVITPVQIDGAVVGFLLLSHIVQGADEQSEWSYAQKCCSAYAIDKTALQKAYNALPRTPYPVLKSAADLLALAAAALYQKGLTRLAAGSAQEKLTIASEGNTGKTDKRQKERSKAGHREEEEKAIAPIFPGSSMAAASTSRSRTCASKKR